MTVRELIEKLEKMPQDLPVLLEDTRVAPLEGDGAVYFCGHAIGLSPAVILTTIQDED